MIVPQNGQSDIYAIIDHLNDCTLAVIQELIHSLAVLLAQCGGHSFNTALSKVRKDVTVIDSASSDFFSVYITM